jgi:hypothetical protein
MVAAIISSKISAAIVMEGETHQLARRLQQRLPHLACRLVLPEPRPTAGLLQFITDYIDSVPGCLRLVAAVSQRMGFYDYAAPFLDTAEDYFLHPPEHLPADGGLEALLDEAFLAHRLLEEVNDHHIRHLQRPLLPVDMTEANIIVHHLLGDELANELDQLVQETAAPLLEQEHLWAQVRALPGSAIPPTQMFTSNNLARSAVQIRLRLPDTL